MEDKKMKVYQLRSVGKLGKYFGVACGLVVVTASAASACPNLDGQWTCVYDGSFGHKEFNFEMKTTTDRSGTVYVTNGESIYTDGEQHHVDKLPILDQFANNFDYVATCEGDVINLSGSGTVTKPGLGNGMTADMVGTLTLDNPTLVSTKFNVSVGFFFSEDFDVPCNKVAN